MKNMNKREGKKIAVMAAVIMGLMVFAFMPMASATVTSFTVTPSTGLAGAVDSYNALVTTDGVTTINMAIPAGFIAVTPTTGGVEIARVDFWNSSTKAYYGHATITSNIANPTTDVDVYCKIGGDEVTTTQNVDYTAGATNTFVSGFGSSSAIIKLPTKTVDGSIELIITCEDFYLDDVMIAIKQFVKNPTTAGDYDFIADGVTATVTITAPSGRGIVFVNGKWWADTDGDHLADKVFMYGFAPSTPLIGDFGSEDIAVVSNTNRWYVDTNHDLTADKIFMYGPAGTTPLVGDVDNDGTGDLAAVSNTNKWWIDTTGDHAADQVFTYGPAGSTPLIGDFNGDGVDDIAAVLGGKWWVDTTGDHAADLIFTYGFVLSTPLVGDFDGDGTDDIAIVSATSKWYVDTDGDHAADLIYMYGFAGSRPLIGEIA